MREVSRSLMALAAVVAGPGPWVVGAAAQGEAGPAVEMPGGLTDRPEQERAIRGRVEAFAAAYNAADVEALASLFAEDAEVIDELGAVVEGREAIRGLFEATFAEEPGARIAIGVDRLRFLGPDAAKEEGRTRVTLADGSVVRRRYTVLYAERGGSWMYESVREEPDPGAPPGERLKQLEWLVGDWFDEGASSVVHSTCRWSDDGHFLLREFEVRVGGEAAMAVSERIGWDPLTRQIRSWVFDSTGGYSEGIWARAEDPGGGRDGWLVKSVGVLPDGRVATATYAITPPDPDTIRWESADRTLAGGLVPGTDEHILVRRPPPPDQ